MTSDPLLLRNLRPLDDLLLLTSVEQEEEEEEAENEEMKVDDQDQDQKVLDFSDLRYWVDSSSDASKLTVTVKATNKTG